MDRRFFEALSPKARVELLCRLHAWRWSRPRSWPGIRPRRGRRRPKPLRPVIGELDGAVPPPPRPHRPHRNHRPAPGASPASSAAAKGSGGASPFKPSAMRTITRPSVPRAPHRSRCGTARAVTAPTSCSTWSAPRRHPDRLRRHRYHAIECACGVQTAARPGVGVLSTVPGRSRDLLLSEACLAALATFIAALSVRYHTRIRGFQAVVWR